MAWCGAMLDLAGKVVLVTGASSGLGEATARTLARHGAKVALAARRADRLAALQQDIEREGGEALSVVADVLDGGQVDAMVARTVERFGRLDGAVNNAGIAGSTGMGAADIPEETWHAVIDTNLNAVWRCMKAEIPAMLPGGGAIVNVSSIYGLGGSEIGHAAYATSKFGVIGLTESAAIDYGQSGVRINAVCPGFCHSEMVDPSVEANPDRMAKVVERHSAMNRLGEAAEIADVVAWLLSDSSSFVNGAAIRADGGRMARLF